MGKKKRPSCSRSNHIDARLAEPTLRRRCEWLVVSAFEERASQYFEETNTNINSWAFFDEVCTDYYYLI